MSELPSSARPTIAVMIPVKEELHPDLRQRAVELAQRLPGANPGFEFTLVMHTDTTSHHTAGRPLAERVAHTAIVRNRMLERFNHDYALWVDADIIDYPADLPTRLVAAGGVAAPVVLLDKHPGRFYDLAGFVAPDGSWARFFEPWWPGLTGPVYDLMSVGCVYLVPRAVYDSGARHEANPHYTEHMSVCRAATALGLPVRCDSRLRAYHAWLPDYGEAAQ